MWFSAYWEAWIVPLEAFSRQLLRVLPPDRSLVAITTCAVVYGGLCWTISKGLVSTAVLGRELLAKAAKR